MFPLREGVAQRESGVGCRVWGVGHGGLDGPGFESAQADNLRVRDFEADRTMRTGSEAAQDHE